MIEIIMMMAVVVTGMRATASLMVQKFSQAYTPRSVACYRKRRRMMMIVPMIVTGSSISLTARMTIVAGTNIGHGILKDPIPYRVREKRRNDGPGGYGHVLHELLTLPHENIVQTKDSQENKKY
jgi:hypothetical protein